MVAANTSKTFWARVNKRGPRQLHMRSRCWVWTANKDPEGYGRFHWQGKLRRATRVAWFLATGSWPTAGALHRCDYPPCVRFSHLFEGGALENNRDSHAKGRAADHRGDLNPSRRHPERVPRGEKHPKSKFTTNTIRVVRWLYANSTYTQADLAKRYGISRPQMCMILNRKAWRHI